MGVVREHGLLCFWGFFMAAKLPVDESPTHHLSLSGIPSASSLTPPSPNPGSDANGYLQEGFPGSSAGKESPVMQETQVQFLGWKDTLEK